MDQKRNSVKDKDIIERQKKMKKEDLTQENLDEYIDCHADAISRSLFIYAGLNKGIKYI